MKPAQLIPLPLAFVTLALTAPAGAQATAPAVDAEPAAAAPAAPPTPAPAAQAAPSGADLPPPPPPRAEPPPPPEGRMVISTPAVEPARLRRGYHVHDGFYLRLAAGLGAGRGHVSSKRDASPDLGIGSGGLALNLWVGGTPWKGIAVGGLIALQGLNDGEAEIDGRDSNQGTQNSLGIIGAFVDAFPDDRRGLHVGGSLGLGLLNSQLSNRRLREQLDLPDYNGGGLGVSGWVGYMGFVGPEWSLGGLLQLTGVTTAARKEDDGLERSGSAWALSLSFTALYH